LRAVDARIGESERRLFDHVKLMERLNDRGADNVLSLANCLRKDLEAGLLLSRATREKLLRDLEQD